ncbi:hypothetical protein ACFRAR_16695 [Kitasatospora sp. NPDC056651]|uniref:hypothetical protein n=1 Tax=Kitasatospora sp. NPDC056651 TaxID=3345892 RepID=UPI00367CBE01
MEEHLHPNDIVVVRSVNPPSFRTDDRNLGPFDDSDSKDSGYGDIWWIKPDDRD